jgi:hypothetical protein
MKSISVIKGTLKFSSSLREKIDTISSLGNM